MSQKTEIQILFRTSEHTGKYYPLIPNLQAIHNVAQHCYMDRYFTYAFVGITKKGRRKVACKVAQYMPKLLSKELMKRQINRDMEVARQYWKDCPDSLFQNKI